MDTILNTFIPDNSKDPFLILELNRLKSLFLTLPYPVSINYIKDSLILFINENPKDKVNEILKDFIDTYPGINLIIIKN